MNSNGRLKNRSAGVPSVAHVEVGGTAGGSVLKLRDYLSHCDPSRFRHTILFYRRPQGIHALNGNWPVVDLGLPVPPMSRPSHGAIRHRVRSFLERAPRLRSFVNTMRSGWRLIASLPLSMRLAREFRRGHYDLVHCNNSFTYQIPTVLAAWLAGLPLVCHFRTIRKLGVWDRWLSRRPVAILAICQTIANDLHRQSVRAPVLVCYDPNEIPSASAEITKSIRKELLKTEKMLVGTVTRLEDWKGVEDFLAAVRLLRSARPEVRYVVVGDGSKASAFHQLSAELHVEGVVRFAGYRTNVFDYCASLDIFVCPSLVEGAQAVVLEAMLMGRPVIATRVGWAPELIKDGENGMLVDPADPQALAGAIDSLLADPARRDAMGRRAAASVRHFCDPTGQARQLDETFAGALSKPLVSRMDKK